MQKADHAPKISVGLPVYNGENFVRYAIESVLQQTYSDWELVISDNGSTDATEDICRDYAEQDTRIRYHRSQSNQGAAWNFNRVFELSSGEYFRWLSHDDYMMPPALDRCLSLLESDPSISICASATGALDSDGYQILDAGGQSDLACQGLTIKQEQRRKEQSQSNSPATRFHGILINSRRCNEIYGLARRDLMQSTQLHPPYCGGEKVLLAEFALKGKVAEVPELLFFVRWHLDRFTSNSSTKDQAQHMQPNSDEKRKFVLPHQYRATLGYLALVATQRLSLWERAKCLSVWLRFTLQVSKWKSILLNTFRGKSTWAEIHGDTSRGQQIHTIHQSHTAQVQAVGSNG